MKILWVLPTISSYKMRDRTRKREEENGVSCHGKTQAVMHLNLGTIGTLFQGKSFPECTLLF